jgi:DNA replication and repair protein RecF
MIEKLRLFQFRNFEDQTIEFSPTANIFIGMNGQGKSNILESIHYLFLGESFRPAQINHLIREGQTQTSIQMLTSQNGEKNKINLKIQNGHRSVQINQKKAQPSQLSQIETPILFSPESLSAIKGSSEERRRLVDHMLICLNPKKMGMLSDFRKLLRTKNKILKDRIRESITEREAFDLLEAIAPRFLQVATDLTWLRIQTLQDLMPWMNTIMSDLSPEFPEIRLQYLISEQDFIHSSFQNVSNMLQKRLKEMAITELSSGVSLVGPHKHDILFLFGGNDSRFFCSQGQQRCLILAFKLAQIVYHRKVFKKSPLLLLDDVLSELDGEKRNAFLRMIETMEAQVIITTTDSDLASSVFGQNQTKVHRVVGGGIK